MKTIAITQRVILKEDRANMDALEQDYIEYFEQFDINLIPFPNKLSKIDEFIKNNKIDGFILSGGNNVNPLLYNGKKLKKDDFCKDRDETETKILEFAIKNNLPVFAECRGCQFLNVFFGGSLNQDLKEDGYSNHVNVHHEISFFNQKIKSFLEIEKTDVNSYHNQGITLKTISKELMIFAKTSENVIEGIYHPKYPIAGIMWHPERKSNNPELNEKLFKAFLNREIFWI